jgi:hypothetical protein
MAQRRLNEFCAVLKNNIENPCVDKICLFVEDVAIETSAWPEAEKMRRLWEMPKIQLIKDYKRHTYADLIEFANSQVSCIVLISNCDIYYDETLKLLETIDFSRRAVCLSKIEIIDENGRLFYLTSAMKGYSQDSWAFKPPIRKMPSADFYMGIQRCDNRIAWEFNAIGLVPFNPSESIRSYHYHLSGVRTYRQDIDCVSGPILFVSAPYHL